jgi:mannose/fructose/N-acetylgalactosamine-specific phosphotransferase system component IIC
VTHLTWRHIVPIVAVAGAAGWIVTRVALSRGATPQAVPWTVAVVCVVLAVAALILAWAVREYKQGKKPDLSGIRAARTAAFAQASAYAGAVVAGVYGGYAGALADMWGHAPRRETAISALIAVLGGLLLLTAGIVAEHWCKTDPRDDENDHGGSAAHAS